MNDDLYQIKYKYERLMKNFNDTLSKLECCYSNLILCKGKITNCLSIDDNCYKNMDYEKIISDIESNIKIIKNVIIPEIKCTYNEVLLKISRL